MVVVDTDVASFLHKGDTRREAYRALLEGQRLVLSFMTVAELERWALKNTWGQRRIDSLRNYVRGFVLYPFRDELCLIWAQAMDHSERAGVRMQCADGWVAAVAMLEKVPLVTHNARHYKGLADRMEIVTVPEGDGAQPVQP